MNDFTHAISVLRRMYFSGCAIGLSADPTLTADLAGVGTHGAVSLGAVAAGLGEDAITTESTSALSM
jgi:hypothetical protein